MIVMRDAQTTTYIKWAINYALCITYQPEIKIAVTIFV